MNINHYNSYKKFKKKLISKYKRNISRNSNGKELDQFVSIDDFLAKELSKGPDEDPGTINYEYGQSRNVFNYFKILSDHYGFDKVLCIPEFVTKNNNTIWTTSVLFFIDENKLIFPDEFKNKILSCISSSKRFVYFSLIIRPINHINIIVIDLYKKTIERFEPQGHNLLIDELDDSKLDFIVKNKFIKEIGLQDYTYIPPAELSPKFGPQIKADVYDGMCVSYVMLYLQLRLMNPDLIQKQLVQYLNSKPASELKKLILRYTKFIEITLKKYSYQTFETFEFLKNEFDSVQKFIIITPDSDSTYYLE